MSKPVCPKCRQGGYTEREALNGRPEFKCTRCDYVWTNGRTGGEFHKHNPNKYGYCWCGEVASAADKEGEK